jgi:hypothetical protein
MILVSGNPLNSHQKTPFAVTLALLRFYQTPLTNLYAGQRFGADLTFWAKKTQNC